MNRFLRSYLLFGGYGLVVVLLSRWVLDLPGRFALAAAGVWLLFCLPMAYVSRNTWVGK